MKIGAASELADHSFDDWLETAKTSPPFKLN